ncbi:hypothetical protein OESDEN_10868 [Oesophagostomum dentatum]|uniref:SXP/RAL-2 family protein Ani s 5-like cation-binding domain-containing protein n=1 Tax=Oesophagostomum dentatum TaxID=61180 RepID=A0A0B1SZH0_OESDE|nr:hypothetical protein OESDEN_10868 [Oesophagostomum dentatum]
MSSKGFFSSEKKKKLDVILARQSESIKQLYQTNVEREKLQYKTKMEGRIARATDPAIKDYWRKVQEIDNDMSISENEADMKEKALKNNLTPAQKRMLED